MPKRSWDVVVVGAGAAGLAAAEELSRAGLSILLLEARARLGGRIFTRRLRGWPVPIELGPEFVHGRSQELFQIARDAGLLIDRLPDVHVDATAADWRLMHDFWARFEAITRQMRHVGRDRSVAEFLKSRRRMSPAQRRLAESMVEGYHAAFLERASERALSTAGEPPLSPERQVQFRLVSGYNRVAEWLRGRIDRRCCRILFSAPARHIRWRRGAVTVRAASTEFRARHAILSVPVGVLKAPPEARGAIRFDPDPPVQRRALERLEMGQVVKIVLLFREAFWEGTPAHERLQERQAREIAFFNLRNAAFPTWWTAAPAQVPMITGWAGGPAAQVMLGLPGREVFRRSIEALATLFRLRAAKLRRLLVSWHLHDWSADPFARGAYSYVAVGGAAAPAALARPVEGTLFFAGEATEPDQSGTVPGAIASGRRAARLILG
jgi:monoamine oxidase